MSSPQPPSGFLARWEGLHIAAQVGLVYVLAAAALVAVHLAFFHRITTARSVTYALMEALLVTWVVVAATRNEIARRDDTDEPR